MCERTRSGLSSQYQRRTDLSPAISSLVSQRMAANRPVGATTNGAQRGLPMEMDRIQRLSPTTANKNAARYLIMRPYFLAHYPGDAMVFRDTLQVRAEWLTGGKLAVCDCICCRETLTSAAACLMNCCNHVCNSNGKCGCSSSGGSCKFSQDCCQGKCSIAGICI